MMDNLQPSNIDPSDLPQGFSAQDPSGAGAGSSGGAAEKQQENAQKQGILEQALTPEALARLRRIKLVKGAKATQLENALVNMAVQGKLPGRVTEGKLIEMLERSAFKEAAGSEQKIQFSRKKYAMDSDDSDDNDDDLM